MLILYENDDIRVYQRGEKYYFCFPYNNDSEAEISRERAYKIIEARKATIYQAQGLRILQRGDKYYMRFEYGGLASFEKEIEISKEDAYKVMEDDNYALKIIVANEKKEREIKQREKRR